jgi:dolichol-phosphate mannosyltransferase
MPDGVSIVTTTWNERENIEKLIHIIRIVLRNVQHEIIVVDDSSPDRTFQTAKELADKAVKKHREGQSKGLLCGMKLAQYPTIVTIDADLENDPRLIPELVRRIGNLDIVVASRTRLPRISERLTSKIIGKEIGVKDIFSNFRAYKKTTVPVFELRGGETFGAEFLIIAKRKGLKIGEMNYEPPARRKDPRIGGSIKANLRIAWALVKSLGIYLQMPKATITMNTK